MEITSYAMKDGPWFREFLDDAKLNVKEPGLGSDGIHNDMFLHCLMGNLSAQDKDKGPVNT